MQLSQKKVCLILAFFAVAVSSASAKSIQNRDDNELTSYDDMLKSIDNLRNIIFAGPAIAPIAAASKGLLQNIDKALDGNFAKVINSIMPCKINGMSSKCEGRLDVESVRQIAKKVLALVPLASLPRPVASVVRMAKSIA